MGFVVAASALAIAAILVFGLDYIHVELIKANKKLDEVNNHLHAINRYTYMTSEHVKPVVEKKVSVKKKSPQRKAR